MYDINTGTVARHFLYDWDDWDVLDDWDDWDDWDDLDKKDVPYNRQSTLKKMTAPTLAYTFITQK